MEVHGLGDHPWLQFADEDDAYRQRLQRLLRFQFDVHRHICWDSLGELATVDRARTFIPVDSPWDRFFLTAMRPSYPVLMLEFMSTFTFCPAGPPPPPPVQGQDPLPPPPPEISFRLMGHAYQMSLRDFSIRIGFYTAEEMGHDIYTRAIYQRDLYTLQRFWYVISGGGFFTDSSRRASDIVDPLHRYMHMLIAWSMAPRYRGREHVTSGDLFFLYCLIWRSQPCHLGYCMAQFFQSAVTRRETGYMYGGSYITALADGLGLPLDDALLGDDVPSIPSGMHSIRAMGVTGKNLLLLYCLLLCSYYCYYHITVAGRFGEHTRFRTADRRRFVPEELPQELPHLPGPGFDEVPHPDDPAAADDDAPPQPPPPAPHAPQHPQHVYREVQIAAPVRAQIAQLTRDVTYIRQCVQLLMQREAARAEAAGEGPLDIPVYPAGPFPDDGGDQGDAPPP